MTPHDLIAAFDKLAEAADGIMRVRELVLELAVRGKLVAQHSNDEPATALLERVEARRAALVEAGRLRRSKKLPLITGEDIQFELPPGWRWARLGTLFIKISDGTHHSPPNGPVGDHLYVTAKNIKEDGVSLRDITYVSTHVHDEIFARCDPELGDVLYVKDGATTGVVTVNDLDRPFSLLSSVGLLKVGGLFDAWWACWAMRSPFFYDQVRGAMSGSAIQRVTLTKLNRALLPVPPLAEQRRIVGRVDELMGLLNRLEAARNAREGTRAALRDAALAALQDADTPEEVEVAWARIASHIHELFTDPADVEPLRQTVLQLAVRGRLVPQDPNDESAETLLGHVAKARQEALAQKKARFARDRADFHEADELPNGWAWAPLQDLFRFIDYRGKTPRKTESGVLLITAKNVRDGYVKEEPREYVAPSTYDEWMTRGIPRPGDILFTTEAPMGKAALVDIGDRFALAQRIIDLQPYGTIDTRYMMWVLLSPWFQARLAERATGMTATGIKAEKLKLIRVPVPPSAEQDRIANKVDELRALLDRLERRLAKAKNSLEAAAAAAVHHLEF
ncbi:MAG: restriction endonuclease subunit S [Deltaproteobacteria bacterium]